MPSMRHTSKPRTRPLLIVLLLLLVFSAALMLVLPQAQALAATGTIPLSINIKNSNIYTITLDNTGGNEPNLKVDITYDQVPNSVTRPTKTGYSFLGYFDSDNKMYFDEKGNGYCKWDKKLDTTLTAHWQADTYTITWNANNGSWEGTTADEITTSVSHGAATTQPTTKLTRTGYSLLGWAKSEDAVETYLPTITTSSAKWYAVWRANEYSVTFIKNGGTGGTGEPGTRMEVRFDHDMPNITPPTKTGYEFLGYFDAETDGKQYYTASGGSANPWDKAQYGAPLYAYWEAKTYTVKFDFAKGDGDTTSTTATFDADMPEITIPTRDGYTFAGYFDGEGNQYYDEKGKSKAKWNKDADNVTLTARWNLQLNFTFPTAALIQVDASGNVTGEDLSFSSQSAAAIKVSAIKSTQSESARSLFADDATLKGVRILLNPVPDTPGSEERIPLTVNETSVPVNWTIASDTTLLVGFNLFLPTGAQLNYFPDDQVSIATLSYEVSAANASS